MKEFGDMIRQARKSMGYSQNDLAKMLHVTQGAVSQWENNITQPDSDQIFAISSVLSISLDAIVSSDGNQELKQLTDDRNIAKKIIGKLPMLSDEQLYVLLGYISGKFGK